MYIDIISINKAKDYLGVDDTSRDTEINRMINSAFKYFEKRTNIICSPIDKTYILNNGCVKVYDHPINTLDTALATTVTRELKGLYSIYTDDDSDNTTLTLNVGSEDIDSDIEEIIFMLIEHYFQEGERSKLPEYLIEMININRRFIL